MAINDEEKYTLTGSEIKTLATKINAKANSTDVYSKTEVDNKLTSAMTYKGTVSTVSALPNSENKVGDVYNVTDTGDNYAWDGSAWDKLSGVVDLSNYYTKTETDAELSGKVDKVSGKGLSEEDFTTTEKTKLQGIEAGAEANVIEGVVLNGVSQPIYNKEVVLHIDEGLSNTWILPMTDAQWARAIEREEEGEPFIITDFARRGYQSVIATHAGLGEDNLKFVSFGDSGDEAYYVPVAKVYTLTHTNGEYTLDTIEQIRIEENVNVVQTTGTSATDVMSQNAVTEALANAGGGVDVFTTNEWNNLWI